MLLNILFLCNHLFNYILQILCDDRRDTKYQLVFPFMGFLVNTFFVASFLFHKHYNI